MLNINVLKTKAKELKLNLLAIYLASRDRRVPWYTRLMAITVVAYAFSPIDLIPDFIPVLGYLDDLILLPFGIILVLKLIPKEIIEELKQKTKEKVGQDKPKNWFVAVLIVVFWIAVLLFLVKELREIIDYRF